MNFRSLPLLLATAVAFTLASGCAVNNAAAPQVRPLAANVAQQRSAEPVLAAAKVSVGFEDGDHDHHHAVLKGAAGALTGMGVWGSVGRHTKPANGEEAMAASNGGFELELHAHPGDEVTLWAFVDQGEKRIYGKPCVFKVPAAK